MAPSVRRQLQLQSDRIRTAAISKFAADRRTALLAQLPACGDRNQRRNELLRAAREAFHAETEAVQEGYLAEARLQTEARGTADTAPGEVGGLPRKRPRRQHSLADSELSDGGRGGAIATAEPDAEPQSDGVEIVDVSRGHWGVSVMPADAQDANLMKDRIVASLPTLFGLYGHAAGAEVAASAFRFLEQYGPCTAESDHPNDDRSVSVRLAVIIGLAVKFTQPSNNESVTIPTLWKKLAGTDLLHRVKKLEFKTYCRWSALP